ncbi:MAG: SIR2 family NAD-dependent protein deacylase [Bacteroidia bacterium]
MGKKRIIVFTGAGMSAESGIRTFRDSGGLWEQYKIEDVATPEAWQKNPRLVLEFYNQRRKQVAEAQPNKGHLMLAALEKDFDVQIITQNIDDLHERAGSKKVLHLHGQIMKAQSSIDPNLVYPMKKLDIVFGDKCEKGSQLRPHIVWFGEMVPEMENAINMMTDADIFITVGTSLVVYPAAGLIHYAPSKSIKYLVDPGEFDASVLNNLRHIKEVASTGLQILAEELKKSLA